MAKVWVDHAYMVPIPGRALPQEILGNLLAGLSEIPCHKRTFSKAAELGQTLIGGSFRKLERAVLDLEGRGAVIRKSIPKYIPYGHIDHGKPPGTRLEKGPRFQDVVVELGVSMPDMTQLRPLRDRSRESSKETQAFDFLEQVGYRFMKTVPATQEWHEAGLAEVTHANRIHCPWVEPYSIRRVEAVGFVGVRRTKHDKHKGRIIAQGMGNPQSLPARYRVWLSQGLDGQWHDNLTYLDYSANHLRMLYAWGKEDCPADPYGLLADMCFVGHPDARALAKTCTLLAFNSGSGIPGALKKIDEGIRETLGILKGSTDPIPWEPLMVLGALRELHGPIAHRIGKKPACSLMDQEGEIMVDIALGCMAKRIPLLPIHDGVIVPQCFEKDTRSIMVEAWRATCGKDRAVVITAKNLDAKYYMEHL